MAGIIRKHVAPLVEAAVLCRRELRFMLNHYPERKGGACERALNAVDAALSGAAQQAAEIQRYFGEEMAHWPGCPAGNDYSEAGWAKCNCHMVRLRALIADYLAARAADAAEIERLRKLCRELWGSRRSMAYGPNGERAMLEQYPWLQEQT